MADLKFPDDYLSYDSMDLLSKYRDLPQDIKAAYALGDNFTLIKSEEEFDNIFFMGMGGSAIAFDFLKAHLIKLGLTKPITIVRDYNPPNTITKKSLVFVASYSGQTEETLSAHRAAFKQTPHIYCATVGGKLEEMCKLNRTPCLIIPKDFQPRTAALSYLFFPFLKLLERLKLIQPQFYAVNQIIATLTKPTFRDLSISISEKLVDKIPLIYASSTMASVAYRMKTSINENAKVHAFSHNYSELNHNEMMGFTNIKGNYHVITFKFNDDHRRIQKRMELMKEITNAKGIATTEIALTGDEFLTKLFSAVVIGDLTSIFLALRYKTDPSPVLMVEEFKKKLGTMIV